MEHLSEREKTILQSIIHQFILTAKPVGSMQISRQSETVLKSASIRRIMASLEEKGYLSHPHTSAGRVPTTEGYRFYVDQLINKAPLNTSAEDLIKDTVEKFDGDVNFFIEQIAGVLAQISKQLSIIVTPKFYQGIFDHMQVVPVSANRLMVIISVTDGEVKSILVEIKHKINKESLRKVIRKINQRFHGKTLREIKNTFADVMADIRSEETGLIRLFSETADRLFDFDRYDNYTVNGTSNIIAQPEFSDVNRFSTLIELLEDKNIVIHFMEKREYPPGMRVTIGDENEEKMIRDCSVVTSTYRVGNISGVVGIIGPTRMNYRMVIPLVDFTASTISDKLG